MNIISRSRSLTQQEEKLNQLISNMLVYVISLLYKDKTGETPTEQKMLNYLKNLPLTNLIELECLINIINSGRIKKLSKFINLDVQVFYDSNNVLCTAVDFIPLSDPAMYRKISKKLKDLKLSDIKDLFENYHKDLCFLIDVICEDIEGFNTSERYREIDKCLNETESIVRDISLEIVTKFTNSAIVSDNITDNTK